MLTNLKALVVVLAIALTIFRLAKPLALKYIDAAAYSRRRNIWLALTVVGFITPSFWLYALVAAPLTYWGCRKDDNPLALYLWLSLVVPNASVQIPVVGIGQLFALSPERLLAFTILIPLVVRKPAQGGLRMPRKLTAMDWSLVAFCVLQMALPAPYESITNTVRRGVLLFLDTFILFYCFSRLEPSARAIKENLASFCLVMSIVAAIGLFESVRGWLLYQGIYAAWGTPNDSAFLLRGDSLRAQASTGHALGLSFCTALGAGVWFYLMSAERKLNTKFAVLLLLCGGLLVTYSRGGWVTCMVIYTAFFMLRPDFAKYAGRALPVVILLIVVAFNSPLKESVIDRLPIIGNADQDTVDYREQVARVSWQLVQLNPWFGDPFVTRNMEQLRQGQGIIDIVNGYALVSLYNGLVGLALFASIFLIAIGRTYRAMRFWRPIDPDKALLGADLLACMLGTLVFIAAAGMGPTQYWLTAMMACYANMAASARRSLQVSSAGFARQARASADMKAASVRS